MTFFDKIKWTLGILMVFALILITNLIDKNNFTRVKDSVVSIYEDRLVVNDLIFEMSKLVQEKEMGIVLSNTHSNTKKNSFIDEKMKDFIEKYEATKLTVEERTVFNNFKDNIQSLSKMESSVFDNDFKEKETKLTLVFEIKENLYDLTKIQLNEGKKQMSISQKAIDTVELFSQIEIYFLVFLAIVVQIIVMYDPKKEKLK
ncbi:MAG: chemotaxis protein [Flavobacteriia bacterium]|nr:chemotaxis protein [Flavobacteriia bacterium]OIP47899.1 MAG: chemotaxis protein [Flavobacteriaceae bacterium CG2_30_31_66]PIV97262.1 MAG: chemotaxis protein [Flavobacteriaceae bacterium CG17_big_fil_post_rev_8_21_14_2_50_31_13]PIX13760.1 MAG: chemotaxis protein [Flavobacteriaceae bacterium CG_4_8_14_3_um_filter_31_8]PIY15447.1 MAG: chemotaxis protein [Flavobacteriaceae bacterium CG_4_10_14_3_um_filter_31_253]PIZ12331.1 MAG: chemotaxis protein [Flavobacteriaceae bacterium CG_4_10_14_0_8_um_f